jgi:hypothetical protein
VLLLWLLLYVCGHCRQLLGLRAVFNLASNSELVEMARLGCEHVRFECVLGDTAVTLRFM